jgi:Double-GTPase 2
VAPRTCEKPDCTVAETGKCLLSHASLAECPYFRTDESESHVEAAEVGRTVGNEPPTKEKKKSSRAFHLGAELGAQDALAVMRGRYAHVIGVLGRTDAGKTCFLSSLYLMASGGSLPEPYHFAGSLTLQAFEDRARGLRQWKGGQLSKQLADHTVLTDPRQPSLLHLAIRESTAERRRFDLLLTDLPGEWTDNLILRASHVPSFRFLQRADGIVLLVDGNLLMSDSDRHAELQRMRHFIERLANDVNVSRDTPLVIVVSKSDEIDMLMPPAASELWDFARGLGFPATAISAASFSRKPASVKSGTGVFKAIETVLSYQAPNDCYASASEYAASGVRAFGRFRG